MWIKNLVGRFWQFFAGEWSLQKNNKLLCKNLQSFLQFNTSFMYLENHVSRVYQNLQGTLKLNNSVFIPYAISFFVPFLKTGGNSSISKSLRLISSKFTSANEKIDLHALTSLWHPTYMVFNLIFMKIYPDWVFQLLGILFNFVLQVSRLHQIPKSMQNENF